MTSLRGKSLTAISKDIAEGFVVINPIFLKPIDIESLKALHEQLRKIEVEIRGEKFPFNDITAIRRRNMRLQRLHSANMIIKNYVKERRLREFL